MLYRAYILFRLKVTGCENDLIKRISKIKADAPDSEWEITYATPIYGGWDLIAECSFTELEDMNVIINMCRMNEGIAKYIEETTTLIGTRPNYK